MVSVVLSYMLQSILSSSGKTGAIKTASDYVLTAGAFGKYQEHTSGSLLSTIGCPDSASRCLPTSIVTFFMYCHANFYSSAVFWFVGSDELLDCWCGALLPLFCANGV